MQLTLLTTMEIFIIRNILAFMISSSFKFCGARNRLQEQSQSAAAGQGFDNTTLGM
jgi:hypothetical protein